MSDAGTASYDPIELRRRIAVSFSVPELRALAESLGVGGVPWERGIDEAAREVVRQCERYAGLPALVARLREVRPLLEWPEPGVAPVAAPHAVSPAPATLAAAPAFPSLSASPGSFGGTPAPAPAPPPLQDPYAPPPGPTAIQVPAARAAPFGGVPRPSAGTWPMPPAPSRTFDPRILIAGAAVLVVVVAVAIAFFAGRATSTTEAATPAPSSHAPASAAHPRGDGPAARAAGAIARSFAEVARVCELPPSVGQSAAVLRRAYDRCGPPRGRRHGTPLAPDTNASTDPSAPADPTATPRTRHGRGGDAPPPDAPAADGCIGACDSKHRSCKSGCGPEPTESSAYDTFSRCQARCLSDASRCRLSCR